MNGNLVPANEHELTYKVEVVVLRKKNTGTEANPVFEIVEESEIIDMPRLQSRNILKLRRLIMAKYGEHIVQAVETGNDKLLLEAGLDAEAIGEMILDLLVPGLLDRLTVASFKGLIDTVNEVEAHVLNPTKTTPKAKGSTTSTRKKP